MEVMRTPNLFSGRNFVPVVLLIAIFQWFAKAPARAAPAAGDGADRDGNRRGVARVNRAADVDPVVSR
jgi:hypothetical protein